MAIIHCDIEQKIINLTNQSADLIGGKVSDIFHNEIIAETVAKYGGFPVGNQ